MSFGKVICQKCGFEIEKDESTSIQLTGVVLTDVGNAEGAFKAEILDVLTDGINGDFALIFTSGALVDEMQQVTDFDASTKIVTVGIAFSGVPVAGDKFVVVKYK